MFAFVYGSSETKQHAMANELYLVTVMTLNQLLKFGDKLLEGVMSGQEVVDILVYLTRFTFAA
jgi:hypothetical protein